jgi:hypothetical protein
MPNRTQGQMRPAQGEEHREKENTKRHVYVEPGVQIDFVEDLKREYKTANSQNSTHSERQLQWSKVSTGLIFVYALLTLLMYCATKKSADAAEKAATFAEKQWNMQLEENKPVLTLNDWNVPVGVHPDLPSGIFAIVRVENDGHGEARFLQVAARLEFRSDKPTDFRFNDSDFSYTSPLPPILQPFSYDKNNTADSPRFNLAMAPSNYQTYSARRLYVWGAIRCHNWLNISQADAHFCRYTDGRAIVEMVARKAGQYARPWNKCDPIN